LEVVGTLAVLDRAAARGWIDLSGHPKPAKEGHLKSGQR